jgi:hypothetical protein
MLPNVQGVGVLRQVGTMQPNVNTLERAFELARTGEFDRIGQIKNRLKLEGYSSELIVGSYLSAQLRELMRLAQPQSYGLLSDRGTTLRRTA